MRLRNRKLTAPHVASLCEATGTCLIAVALWWIYPALSLLFLGLAAFAVSYAIERGRRTPAAGTVHTPGQAASRVDASAQLSDDDIDQPPELDAADEFEPSAAGWVK